MSNETQETATIPEAPQGNEVSKEKLPFRRFLEEFSVNTVQKVSEYYRDTGNKYYKKNAPQLRLWCDGADCRGYRRFDGGWDRQSDIGAEDVARDFLTYTCRDCGTKTKTFCIMSAAADGDGGGHVIKMGEYPEVHIDIPPYLPTLLGEEYEYFIKGLKSEKRGLGIGAFSYYRRVVENQKGRMFKQMADAATKLRMPKEVVDDLLAAAQESQFANAIDKVKDHFPEPFKIDGHNPMKTLHRVLSDGLHGRTDDECLEIAHSVRIVLQDMSQRIKDALRDDAEARAALSALMKRQASA